MDRRSVAGEVSKEGAPVGGGLRHVAREELRRAGRKLERTRIVRPLVSVEQSESSERGGDRVRSDTGI